MFCGCWKLHMTRLYMNVDLFRYFDLDYRNYICRLWINQKIISCTIFLLSITESQAEFELLSFFKISNQFFVIVLYTKYLDFYQTFPTLLVPAFLSFHFHLLFPYFAKFETFLPRMQLYFSCFFDSEDLTGCQSRGTNHQILVFEWV